jgi:hypothetical protein
MVVILILDIRDICKSSSLLKVWCIMSLEEKKVNKSFTKFWIYILSQYTLNIK